MTSRMITPTELRLLPNPTRILPSRVSVLESRSFVASSRKEGKSGRRNCAGPFSKADGGGAPPRVVKGAVLTTDATRFHLFIRMRLEWQLHG